MKTLQTLVLIVLVAFTFAACKKKVQIVVKVTNAYTGEPIPNVGFELIKYKSGLIFEKNTEKDRDSYYTDERGNCIIDFSKSIRKRMNYSLDIINTNIIFEKGDTINDIEKKYSIYPFRQLVTSAKNQNYEVKLSPVIRFALHIAATDVAKPADKIDIVIRNPLVEFRKISYLSDILNNPNILNNSYFSVDAYDILFIETTKIKNNIKYPVTIDTINFKPFSKVNYYINF